MIYFSGFGSVAPATNWSYRYWRIRSDDTYISGDYLGFSEIEMRGTSGGSDLTFGLQPGASASNGSFPPLNAIDNSNSTLWTTGVSVPPSGGHYIYVDMILPVTIQEVVLRVRGDTFREDPVNVYVDGSNDLSTWTTFFSKTGESAWTAGESRTFTSAYSGPVFTSQPTVTGNVEAVSDVASISYTATGSPSVTYQWMRDGVDISSATSSTYTITGTDLGTELSCRVTATSGGYSTYADTQPVAVGPFRYWRIRSPYTSRFAVGNYLGGCELEMRATAGGADQTSGKTITASASNASFPVSRMIDNNLTNIYTTGVVAPPAGGHWIKIDFGSGTPVSVNEITYKVRNDATREDPREIYIECSNDDSNWLQKWALYTPAWTSGETRTFTRP